MALTSGIKLGPYEIVAPLGAGGMGEVYRARDSRLGRELALKVLPEAFEADTERMGRFEREAKVLASLNHPNIASIYGFEESGDRPALVMELVDGPTLADCIRKSPIPIDDALPIAKQIAEGLEYAHECGIVHRDLKPSNIKVTPQDTVKILDFGLAKALEGDPASTDVSSSPTLTGMATQAGMLLGTAAYMSPEQAKGKLVDRRTDIWAFGCILYEMLTGKMAFCGETVTDTLATVIKNDPDWLLLPTATPPHVRVLLRRCLQKDPKQRLRDIGDARISLEEVLSGAPEAVSTATVPIPVRHALPWALAGLLAGALISALVFWRFAAPVAQPMRFSAVTNFAGVQAQPAISPDGRSIAFVSDRDGHYNIYVGLISGGNLVQITNDANLKARPVWSPDGTLIAYARLNTSGIWDIWEVPALGGTPRRLILNATDPALSPDGHLLAYEKVASGEIWVSGISGENPHKVAEGAFADGRNVEPRFSPDGRQIAFVVRATGPYGELKIADLLSGNVRRLTSDNALALSPAWSPDGRSIYFASSRGGTVNLWKIPANGGRAEQITAGEGDDAQLDVSSDAKEIVFSTWRLNTNIAQLDLAGKPGQQTPKLLTTDPGRNQIAPTYSPDGKYLAYFSNLKGAENESIWVSNADGSNPVPLVRDSGINVFPSWTNDGLNVVYQSYEPDQSTPGKGYEFRSVPFSGGAPTAIGKNPADDFFDIGLDGRLLFLTRDHQVEALDPGAHTILTLGTIQTNVNPWSPVRWSPDGRSVAYMVAATYEHDSAAGLWITNFKDPPRQIFRGWADWYFIRGPQNDIYFIEGKPDLNGALCKVDWSGHLTHTLVTVPMSRSYWVDAAQNPQDFFSISPDGRHVAFETQTVLSANIGMIQNVRSR